MCCVSQSPAELSSGPCSKGLTAENRIWEDDNDRVPDHSVKETAQEEHVKRAWTTTSQTSPISLGEICKEHSTHPQSRGGDTICMLASSVSLAGPPETTRGQQTKYREHKLAVSLLSQDLWEPPI